MLERKPPRRDPRVLALLPTADGIEYAALDAWEIAGTGAIPTTDPQGFALSIRRVLLQTRPTVLVCAPPATRGPKFARLLKLAAVAASHSGIPLVSLAADLVRELLDEAPTTDAIAEQYPELRTLGDAAGARALRLASSALTSLNFPSRSYEPSPASRSRASVAAGAPPRSRRARHPLAAATRGPRRTTSRRGRPGRGGPHQPRSHRTARRRRDP